MALCKEKIVVLWLGPLRLLIFYGTLGQAQFRLTASCIEVQPFWRPFGLSDGQTFSGKSLGIMAQDFWIKKEAFRRAFSKPQQQKQWLLREVHY